MLKEGVCLTFRRGLQGCRDIGEEVESGAAFYCIYGRGCRCYVGGVCIDKIRTSNCFAHFSLT